VVQKFHDDHPSAIWHISASQISLQVQKLSDNTQLPTSGSEFATGKDLYSTMFVEIPPKSWSLIPMDITIAVPEGHMCVLLQEVVWHSNNLSMLPPE